MFNYKIVDQIGPTEFIWYQGSRAYKSFAYKKMSWKTHSASLYWYGMIKIKMVASLRMTQVQELYTAIKSVRDAILDDTNLLSCHVVIIKRLSPKYVSNSGISRAFFYVSNIRSYVTIWFSFTLATLAKQWWANFAKGMLHSVHMNKT